MWVREEELTRLERELFSAWTRYLTGNDLGERARSSFESVLSRVESALAASPSGDFFPTRPLLDHEPARPLARFGR